jgi:hypothetical protein
MSSPLAASAAKAASSVLAGSAAQQTTTITGSVPADTASAASAAVSDLATLLKPFTADALASGFATLVGALIGAMLAYLLQRHFQTALEKKHSHIAAHRLMFALLQQINTIVLIQRDYVYQELQNPARFLSIPSTPSYDVTKNVLQLPELAFLIDTKDGRTILYDFYLAQENYIEALNQWNLRSTLHLERVQPALAASGLLQGSEVTEQTLRRALGVHVYGSILNATDNCITSLQRAFLKLADIKVKTRCYLVDRFKSDDFTDFDFPDTYGLVPEEAAVPAGKDVH